VRVVTIKHPPAAIEGPVRDNAALGQVVELSPHVAMLMIAAGWVRGETRSQIRRRGEHPLDFNRRHGSDRRSDA
jgi:hypothetical protein